MKTKVVAIVPSAGYGKRLALKTKKPFVNLGGIPLVAYALQALNASRSVDAIIIASEEGCVDSFWRLVRKFKLNKVIDVVVGGKTRCESVSNCLNRVDASFGIVLIHDGARPFLERTVIDRSIQYARKFGACIAAVPENDTVKLAGDKLFIRKTLNRNMIYRAQTPQVFKSDIIKRAYSAGSKGPVTDDASLVERIGGKVKILPGSYKNIKITTREDLKLAEVFL